MVGTVQYQWQCQPKAEQFILNVLSQCVQMNPALAELEQALFTYTSTRLFDWVDYVSIANSETCEAELELCGYESLHAMPSYRIFHHPNAQLPRIVLKDHGQPIQGVAVCVDSIADYLLVRGISGWIEGAPCSPFRRCCISTENGVSLWVIERRGTDMIEPTYPENGYLDHYVECKEKWETRPRHLADEQEAYNRTLMLVQELVEALNPDVAASLILEIERKYWQSKNTAGQIQKNRQDRLGMGWGNHDHHTFRSSRRHFSELVRIFEVLGFHCRERFYAGSEGGWGAQVMENSRSKLVLFLDVDLSPEEQNIDFAHHSLKELDHLGTVGLWVALHGDSILQAGMHHLEAQFMFDELKTKLKDTGVGMMDPFSDLPHLKQAFTEGEQWKVEPKRVDKILKQGLITQEQADKFIQQGVVGSHMENLQRREGYKGFNQKNVSQIIKKTDPRAHSH